MSGKDYFKDSVKYIMVMILQIALCLPVKYLVTARLSLLTFVAGAAVITVVFNGIFWAIFHKNDECEYVIGIIRRKIGK